MPTSHNAYGRYASRRRSSAEAIMYTRARTQHAQSLLERLPIVSYMLELDGPATPVYISPQIEEIFGVSLHELDTDAHHWTQLVVDEDRAHFVAALQRL